jgi:hypothetical protein
MALLSGEAPGVEELELTSDSHKEEVAEKLLDILTLSEDSPGSALLLKIFEWLGFRSHH